MTYLRRFLLGRREEISFMPPLLRSMWQHKVQRNKWQVETWGPHAERPNAVLPPGSSFPLLWLFMSGDTCST